MPSNRRSVGVDKLRPMCSVPGSNVPHQWQPWGGDDPVRYEVCTACGTGRDLMPRQLSAGEIPRDIPEWKRLAIANGFVTRHAMQCLWRAVLEKTPEQIREERNTPEAAINLTRVLLVLRQLEASRWSGKYAPGLITIIREARHLMLLPRDETE